MKTFRIETEQTNVLTKIYFIDAESETEAESILALDNTVEQDYDESSGFEIIKRMTEVDEHGNSL
jgi:hypothetical protein